MQLFEQRENQEVFCKDSRNKKAIGQSNKRNNRKQVLKRLQRMHQKQVQANQCVKVQDSTDEQIDHLKQKKYKNGKCKKEQKKQTYYMEQQQEQPNEKKHKVNHKKY